MTKVRTLGVAAVFLAGCAVGGASSRFVVPPASAQRAATMTKWDYLCINENGYVDAERKLQAAGLEGWELAAVEHPGFWCLKRPKM